MRQFNSLLWLLAGGVVFIWLFKLRNSIAFWVILLLPSDLMVFQRYAVFTVSSTVLMRLLHWLRLTSCVFESYCCPSVGLSILMLSNCLPVRWSGYLLWNKGLPFPPCFYGRANLGVCNIPIIKVKVGYFVQCLCVASNVRGGPFVRSTINCCNLCSSIVPWVIFFSRLT